MGALPLDGGIDHILVDEAQDTSPLQWQVIERLAQDSPAARAPGPTSAHDLRRRRQEAVDLFLPGRRSPQRSTGCRPSRAASGYGAAAQEHGAGTFLPLRASDPRSVDATFAGPRVGRLTAMQPHAFKTRMPGRVDLWPVVATRKARRTPPGTTRRSAGATPRHPASPAHRARGCRRDDRNGHHDPVPADADGTACGPSRPAMS